MYMLGVWQQGAGRARGMFEMCDKIVLVVVVKATVADELPPPEV